MQRASSVKCQCGKDWGRPAILGVERDGDTYPRQPGGHLEESKGMRAAHKVRLACSQLLVPLLPRARDWRDAWCCSQRKA